MGLLRFLWGPRIGYTLQRTAARDLYGEATGWDFASFGALRRWLADRLENFACPACGRRQVSGAGLLVRYGKVRLFRHGLRRNWSGRVATQGEHYRTVWRVYDIVLETGGEAAAGAPRPRGPAGYLRCGAAGCTWSVERAGQWGKSLLDQCHVFAPHLQLAEPPRRVGHPQG